MLHLPNARSLEQRVRHANPNKVPMNIFVIHNNYPLAYNKTDADAFIIEKPVVYTLTDTALTKDGKPFFIPDFASPCTFQMSLVLRISRLGRSISPRFAHRYYDALTVGVMFTAQNLFEYCVSHSLPWEMAKGFDGAAALGRFVTLTEESKALSGYDFHLERDGETIQKSGMTQPRFSPEELIADISRFYTLRQGDLLYYGFPCSPEKATVNTRLTAFLGNTQVLSFNVK